MPNPIRKAEQADLPKIVEIYNSSIPGRMATADTEPVTVESRQEWFDSRSDSRPIWVIENAADDVLGWCSLRSFYGRPAYQKTVEIAVYIDPAATRRGHARHLVEHAIEAAPTCGITTLLAFIFGHNAPSLRLFESLGFDQWGQLPKIAELDGIERDLIILGKKLR
jgi:phosphinothricin acetyltransferase